MTDPFPDDDKFIIGSVDDVPDGLKTPSTVEDKVYPEGRYIPGQSPSCIYIPAKEIMLKMMRACIKVSKPDELWLFKTNPMFD